MVCVSATILALQATRRFMSDRQLQCYKGLKNNVAMKLSFDFPTHAQLKRARKGKAWNRG